MASSFVFCGNCGAQNSNNHKFCSACGYALQVQGRIGTPASTLTGRLPSHTMLKQRYRILQPIGKGGMGAVYVAQDAQLGDRMVAIKEMSQSGLSPQEMQDAAANFKQEAHLLASLQHPHLPSIHDHFESAGRWYLVMSFIQGNTLEDYVSQHPNKRLPAEEVVQIGQQLCEVLDYLHTYRPPIIFRDLKPSNIMRTDTGHIYLIDFGIARLFKPGQAKDTANYGSAGYSPPEQYGHAQTTERSDIYSLGATLYEILSGYSPSRSPFRLPALTSLLPGVPTPLATLITHMLELDPGRRPASVKAVQQELKQSASSLAPTQVSSVPRPAAALPPTVAATPASASPAQQDKIDGEDVLRKLRNGDTLPTWTVFHGRGKPNASIVLAAAFISIIPSFFVFGMVYEGSPAGALPVSAICFILLTLLLAFMIGRQSKDRVLILLPQGFVSGKRNEQKASIVINFKEVVEFRSRGKNMNIKLQQGLGKTKTVKLMATDYKSTDNVSMKINDAYQAFRSKSSSTP
jgi:serine/threonine protein kinase